MSDQEVTVIPQGGQLVEFGSFRSPDAALKEAQMVASAFGKKARALQLYQKIGESEHLKIEGWQMLAAMYRVTASVESTTYVEFGDARGWEARASAIYVPTGQRISSADAMCLDDEDKWGAVSKYEWQVPEGGGDKVKVKVGDVRKPLQQLRSMAQTRATSKVLSNLLKWVAKMAGFATTPAEEVMPGQDFSEGASAQGNGEHGSPQRSNGGPVISEAQGKRFFAISKSSGKSKDDITALLRHFGFESDKDITKAKYEAICNAVSDPNWKPAPAAQSQPAAQPAAAQGQQPQSTEQTLNAKEVWAEVVRAFKGDVAALKALNNRGFESWDQVNTSDRTRVAMILIDEASKL